ncbi:MAG: protein translocase subunit SecD [Candidatus Omnitrophica bacterium]|nr:protein translocase subunit SecD [Candidatus Omnitrophota bacterium]
MIKRTDLNWRLVIIFGLIIAGAFFVFPFNQNINLGLDLKGGMHVLLRADTSGIAKDKISDAIGGAVEKIRTRIDEFGVKETSITPQGDNSILVQIPGEVDREIIKRVREVGKLEFKIVEEDSDKTTAAISGTVPEGYELAQFNNTSLLLTKEVSLTGADLASSFVGFDASGLPSVKLQFTGAGAKAFAKTTEENVGKRLAIVLDGKVMSAPAIREAIGSGSAEITGDFSMDEARILTSVLNSGALPVPLLVEEERTVGPLLGSDSIRRGINSTILGAIFVAIFMIIYYFLGGVVAVTCILLNILFILAGLHLLHGTLTLPGIAGIILTLGMAVDANVLIYERIREELDAKRPLSIAIKNGFERSKSAIYDSNLTTIIAGIFLFIYGTGPVRGFATTLILGNIISIFTAIWIGKTMFSIFLNRGLKRLPMLRILKSPKIDFIKWRNLCLVVSICIIVAGMFHLYSRRSTIFGIDFSGGQVLEYKITPATNIEKIRAVLKTSGLGQLEIQDFKDVEGGIIIKSQHDVADKSEEILKKNFEQVERLKVTTVGPAVGKTLKEKALLAIVLSLLGILVYVGFKFKHFDFGFAGVVALFHDSLISLAFLSFFGYQIDLLIVTALLTIAGYSINDTIVIYDRIRELSPKMHKLSLGEIINKATNETFSRTIITSFTVIMTVVAIFLLGGEALKGFSFCLLVGFIAGVYSTIYIAAPLVLFFRKSRV